MPFDISGPGCLHNNTYCGLKLGFGDFCMSLRRIRFIFLEIKISGCNFTERFTNSFCIFRE